MDGAGFPPYFWESGGNERHQRAPPVINPVPIASGIAPLAFPADYFSTTVTSIDPSGFFTHPEPSLHPDFFPHQPELSAPTLWDSASAFSWLPASTQQPSRPMMQWDDPVSSFQPPQARPPSTGSSEEDIFGDSYAIDLLMADVGDGYSTSRFSSVSRSNIPEDDDRSSWWSSGSRPVSAAPSSVYGDPSNSPPSVSVEINDTTWPADLPCMEADFDLADEAADMDALLGWNFKPSNVTWLDPGVTSEVAEFPQGIKLTGKNKIYAFHRVTGCPSQFPFRHRRTGYLVNLTNIKGMDPNPDVTVDQIIRDQDSHSWGRGTGARNQVDAYIPGSFFGLSGDNKIACRRAAPECGGITACESLDPVFLKGKRRELDPEDNRILAAATLRTREMQDNTEVGRTLAFHHSLQKWRCRGICPDGTRCDGSICLRKLNTPSRNKNHILLCSKRDQALNSGTVHSQVQILDLVSEELFVKVMNGERIVDEDDTEATCSRIVSGRTGAKGKSACPFNHHQNGLPYVAKVVPLTCDAKMHIYCPWETLHPELARVAIVVPFPDHGHSHPPPQTNKCPHAVAERYRERVRKFGPGASVSKVENAQSTRDLLDGKTPSLFHPGLISRDTKTRIIQRQKAEWNELSSTAANTRQQVATYLSDQEALSAEKRYIQSTMSRDGKRVIVGAHPKLLRSIHDLRTLDCDTTFKPVAGEMQIFEINGWLVAINESVTVMRVWMEVHDRATYKSVWEEIQRVVLKLTNKQLKFKGLHKGGKILGLNSDMEAAPLLGFADAFGPTVDLEHVRSAVLTDPLALLSFVLRICYTHFNRGIPKLLNHTSETRQRIFNLKYIKTLEEVETFKAWIKTLADPQGVLKRWWDNKLMHRWLLRGIIQCLSNIPLEQWNTMEATTNLGEAQHAWNNAQTGISMGIIESFKKYEELDIRRAEEIEVRKATGVSRTSRNEVTDRYANRITRQSRVSERARGAHAVDPIVAGLQTELSEVRGDLALARNNAEAEPSAQATQRVRELEDNTVDIAGEIKLAQAEAKSSSSGRVRGRKVAASSTTSIPTPPIDNSAAPLDVTLVLNAVPPSSTELNSASPASPASGSNSALDLAAMRRTSTRKRAQAEPSLMPSNKRQKKLDDPLDGWVMQDPDTGKELTGKEWVELYPEEFKKRYKKDYQRYLDYLAQLVSDS